MIQTVGDVVLLVNVQLIALGFAVLVVGGALGQEARYVAVGRALRRAGGFVLLLGVCGIGGAVLSAMVGA